MNKEHNTNSGARVKVRPLKNLSEYRLVTAALKNANEYGIRDYVAFRVGMCCVLRISDIIHLRYSDVYTDTGRVKKKLTIKEVKTGKTKEITLLHARRDLVEYKRFLDNFYQKQPEKYMQPMKSDEMETVGTGKNKKQVKRNQYWLFPSSQHPTRHITSDTYYKAMQKASRMTGIKHLGTHTARKTGAYVVYRNGFDDELKAQGKAPLNNIALTMQLLNHSSERATLAYLGIDQETIDNSLEQNTAFDY